MKSLREQVAEMEGWEWGIPWGKDSARFTAPKGYRSPMWSTRDENNSIVWPLSGRSIEELRIDLIDGLPPYDTSSDAILAVIRRRFVEWADRERFNNALATVLVGSEIRADGLNDGGLFEFATATPEQLCRATIAAAGKEGK